MHKLIARTHDRLAKSFACLYKDERGITGLETAIILIAFVVVAAVFSFTVLSTGVFSAERGKETILAGLQKARGSMEMRGSVIAKTDAAGGLPGTKLTELRIVVANAAGGEPIPLDPLATVNTTTISYSDDSQTVRKVKYTVHWLVEETADDLMYPGEVAEIVLDLADIDAEVAATALVNPLGTNKLFTIEVRPPAGGVMLVQRRTPPSLTGPVVDLF